MTNIAAVAAQLGVEEKQVQAVVKQMQYRKAYNARPDVKAKRQMYNKKRQLIVKGIREALKNANVEVA